MDPITDDFRPGPMQTTFPKIAAIVLTIGAVAFMGMSMAAYYGRPDPGTEILAPEIQNYHFEATATETGVDWTVTPIVGDNTTGKRHDNVYKALLDAYRMESTRLQNSTNEMSELARQLGERLDIVQSQQQQDIAAVQSQIARLQAILGNLNNQREQASKTLQDLIVQTTAVREETTDRRQDVMRLQNELEELRTDKFRLEQIRRVLTDRLVRLQLENQALDLRMQQLQSLVNQTATN